MKKLYVISSENGKLVLTETAPICPGVFPADAHKIYGIGSTKLEELPPISEEHIQPVEGKNYSVLV